jgi:class 3 adenylate cyclase
MHRRFRELLDEARGYSEFVVAANVDIRGFSDFSLGVDSAQTAIFVKKVYARLIDGYFSDAAFFKPTGDGLLVLIRFDEADLRETLETTTRNALQIVKEFPTITADEPMINFAVPGGIGIGLARGPASRLATGDETLDYSGRVLNLASRLMDFARPQGVVIDDAYGLDLLPPDLQASFERTEVYIKGVSPNDPHAVFVSNDVQVPAIYTNPLEVFDWATEQIPITTVKALGEAPQYIHRLSHNCRDASKILAKLEHPKAMKGGKKHATLWSHRDLEYTYSVEAGLPQVRLGFGEMYKGVKADGVRDSWPVKVKLSYPRA